MSALVGGPVTLVGSAVIAAADVLSTEQALRGLECLLAALERGTIPLAVKPEVAARMLDISTKTLEKLPIPSVRLGRRTRRYPVKMLLAFLEERAE